MHIHWLSSSFHHSTFYIVLQNVESFHIIAPIGRAGAVLNEVAAVTRRILICLLDPTIEPRAMLRYE